MSKTSLRRRSEEGHSGQAPQQMRTTGTLFVILLSILNPEDSTTVRIQALLDSGCSQDLISPILVTGLELPVQELKDPIVF